ncbi:MAG: M23 family metallopeptidase [Caulobacterales bacterium]
MIGRFAGGAVLAFAFAASAWAAPAPGLRCAGAFAQGGLAICKTAPGAVLSVDGVERGPADKDGWVLAGFARDAGAKAQFAVRTSDGGETKKTYTIRPRQFSIQRVDGLPPQTVNPTDPEVLARIQRDVEAKAKATSGRADLAGWLQGFQWPVKDFRISGPWGNQRVLNGDPKPPHFGVDLAAPKGTTIAAPASGLVTLARPDMHFEGGLVILDHGQGAFSYYLHMSEVAVKEGDVVAQGQRLGAVGATGRATGPHLCWRMRWRDRQLDPQLAIEALANARRYFKLQPPSMPLSATGDGPKTIAPALPAPAPR